MKPILLILTVACGSLLAQEGSVSMKIDLVAWGDEITGLSLKSENALKGVTAKSFNYSKPISYSGPALLEIHKSGGETTKAAVELTQDDKDHQLMPLIVPEENPADPQAAPKSALAAELEKRREKEPTLVCLAKLPSGCARATVLLAPAGGGTYTGYVINDDPSKLPVGGLRVHNLSQFPIRMRFDGKTGKELATRDTFNVPIANGQVIYELAYKDGDVWRMQENNIIPVRADEQTQMIVLKSKNQHFMSADGATGGFLQMVILRRGGSSAQ
jgi:hypothetical protein